MLTSRVCMSYLCRASGPVHGNHSDEGQWIDTDRVISMLVMAQFAINSSVTASRGRFSFLERDWKNWHSKYFHVAQNRYADWLNYYFHAFVQRFPFVMFIHVLQPWSIAVDLIVLNVSVTRVLRSWQHQVQPVVSHSTSMVPWKWGWKPPFTVCS